MSLTDTFIRNVKPASSPRKYFDGEGLFLFSLSVIADAPAGGSVLVGSVIHWPFSDNPEGMIPMFWEVLVALTGVFCGTEARR